MKYILLIISLFVFTLSQSQNKAIGTNENLTFSASYNMSGLLTELAQVTLETSEVKTSKSTLLRLKCTAATYSKWDSFFKIRDLYESYVSPKSLTPYLYKRDINEGGYEKFIQYKFKRKTNTVESIKRKKRGDGTTWEQKKNVPINASTKDLISTIYNIRNLDIHKANPGDSQVFKIIFDNEEFSINVKYLKKETLQTNLGSKECYKLAISINNSNVLKGNNDNLLWLTADANKIPVYAKFKIAVGSGELKIKSATGLKN
ncbi:DUF3108 domain-containing protein [Psychroserpens ponticola]|uniref:DUF3108 domain-containing protein n=1 Tax=Psychroserpens ponticola TaxID=2932268 RepID=A0ABY7S0C9_9FLAO|nr:DUF3108 domain-containing protein [Psychroserpens ponticola]WCO02846.1 DUF3108 domain-containing protein [Psychroserpens ponticola]